MTLLLQTAPAEEPVTVAEAKLNCRVEHAVEDALFAAWITAMRERAEHETGRAFVTQTWDLLLDAFPTGEIELLKPPVQSVAAITYVDPDGATQTVAGANYSLAAGGRVVPALGYAWPATRAVPQAVRVRFVAGYGDASAVPAALKNWIHLQVAAAYRNREAFAAGFTAVSELPNRFVDALLDGERTYL